MADQIRRQKLSPVELTYHMLNRIDSVDPQLRSYTCVTVELALEAARRAEIEIRKGYYRGPLHGVPVAVKDNCYTQGQCTLGGLGSCEPFIPNYDATVVTKLAQAGAVPLGKLNLTEGALSGYHPENNIPVNPWREDLWAGASSSGSGVATAAGLCFAAIGTDTGGSIRLPAMANGIVGLKPTYGRVSRHGVLPLSPTLDHVGVLTRCTIDSAIVFGAIAGFDSKDSTSLPGLAPNMLDKINEGVRGLRIGFDPLYCVQGVDPVLVLSMKRALDRLEKLGARVETVHIPHWEDEQRKAWLSICSYEAHNEHRTSFPMASKDHWYGPMLAEFLALGAKVGRAEYDGALLVRRRFSERLTRVLSSVDAIACSSGGTPFAIDKASLHGGLSALEPLFKNIEQQFLEPTNFSGTPTLSLRCGFTSDGLPLSIQLWGGRLSEPLLCRIGQALESVDEWHRHHPNI